MEKLLKHKPTTKRHDFFKNKLISFVENTDYLPVFQAYATSLKDVQYSDGLMSEVIELEKLQTAFSSDDAGKQLDALGAFRKKYENHVDFGDEGGNISGEILLNRMSYFNNGIAILIFAGIISGEFK